MTIDTMYFCMFFSLLAAVLLLAGVTADLGNETVWALMEYTLIRTTALTLTMVLCIFLPIFRHKLQLSKLDFHRVLVTS